VSRLPSFLRSRALTFAVGIAAAVSFALSASAVQAQSRSVDGRVRRPVSVNADSTGMGPATGLWVTLHRVGKDTAGPIDSIRTDVQGHYAFRWTPFGSTDGVYFASTTWGGIAYFTPPLKNVESRGDIRAPALPEHRVRNAGLVRPVAHVFDDSDDALSQLACDQARSLGDVARARLGGGHHQHVRSGNQLSKRDCDVARSRRKIDDHKIKRTPIGIIDQLIESFIRHCSSPHNCLIDICKKTN
jgi:hypothetical protein